MLVLEQKLNQAVKKLFSTDIHVDLITEREKFGDYSTVIAMILAKKLQLWAGDIAGRIVTEIGHELPEVHSGITPTGYINFTVPARMIFDEVNANWSETYGENQSGQGKKAVVEYPSQNMAKPYSVGHLRPGTQGAAAANILRANGWEIITDNHLGDYGTPFGIWVVGFLKLSSEEKLASDGVYELGRVYIEMKKLLKEEEESGRHELADQVQDWLIKLEQGDATAMEYSRRFKEISLGHLHEIMERLGLKTDYELGETFYIPMAKKLIEEYVEKGLFTKNDDSSVICDISEFGIDVPVMLQKSNGASLYATSDMATLLYRQQTWQPDKVIYAVGAEQKFYFEQLFAMAKKLGVQSELIHLWFGTIDQIVDGKREKMSSRKGVVLMEELLDQAEAHARSIVGDKTVSDDDIRKIAVGAIKFSDFVADRKNGILFDWQTIFALTGFSAAYVQYAGVRVNKILASAQDFELVDFSDYDFNDEKNLLKLLLTYPKLVQVLGESLEIHKLAHFAYDLATAINKYYEKTPILKADDTEKSARIVVLRQVAQVLAHALGILGIEIPGEM